MILVFATVRNEALRLPHFLDHYRRLGVEHFLFVDNASTDGTQALLADQPDVSVWSTAAGYRASRFGLDWLTWLMIRHGDGHWCLTLDADEILVYPYWQTRDLHALTGWLEGLGSRSFPAMMLDLYPKGPVDGGAYQPGDDPFERLCWFDAGNATILRQLPLQSLWIQGGVRARGFFPDAPRLAPTLCKIPLVKWSRRYVYVNSTHSALPRRLNRVYGTDGGEQPSGLLLHTKFLPGIVAAAEEETERRQHFANSALYDDYFAQLRANPDLWTPASRRYEGWRGLEATGLMSRGGWI